MKRIFGVLAASLATIVIGAASALAQTTYPPEPTETESVLGGGGGTAFTGSDVSIFALGAVVLLAAGLVALFVARRRSARAAAA